jgi:hypothetical protein
MLYLFRIGLSSQREKVPYTIMKMPPTSIILD